MALKKQRQPDDALAQRMAAVQVASVRRAASLVSSGHLKPVGVNSIRPISREVHVVGAVNLRISGTAPNVKVARDPNAPVMPKRRP